MVAVIRAVVVLPLLPVITIFVALLAPTTALSTFGSMRRAIIPGKLVPPPTRNKRPEAPANFPAEMARAMRARSSPEGAVLAPLLLVGVSSIFMTRTLLGSYLVYSISNMKRARQGVKFDFLKSAKIYELFIDNFRYFVPY